jgi:glutaminyl-peptide cyclotransferase
MRGARLSGLAILALILSCAATRIEVDGQRAQQRVIRQVEAGPRIPGSPGHAAVRGWIEAELQRLGARIERQQWTDSTTGVPLELTNLIGRFGPESGRPIVLCAHWDTRPWADQDPDSTRRNDPVPGANDAGSGVAVLFEMAELMKRRPPSRPVELVFFDGEDQGRPDHPEHYCLGSRGYAERLAARPADRRPIAAFLFDMVGDVDLGIYPEARSSANARNLVDIVLEGARRTGAAHFHEEPRYDLIDDHVPLLDAGIPAVDIIDFDFEQWHTVDDLPDRTSPASLAEVSRVAGWIVFESALARR